MVFWRRAHAVRGWRVLAPSAAVLLIFIFAAVFADQLMPHNPNRAVLDKKLLPPFWYEAGSLVYPLGTDALGRDILSRMILGARVSLVVATLGVLLSGFIGSALGIVAGYSGKGVDAVIMRVVDGFLSFPLIFLALLIAAIRGPGFENIIIILTLMRWAQFARMMRGTTLRYRSADFVAIAKVAGASDFRIMAKHIFPNVLNTLIVLATIQVGHLIIIESSLSFLGAGIPPPNPSWGGMIASGRGYLASAWWVAVMPGLAVLAVVVAFNLMGDYLRDALDPKLRQI